MFKGLANLAGLIKTAQQLGGQMGQLTEEMKRRRVEGSAGGGMVTIELTGLMEVVACRIDPELFRQNDRELLEDLIVAAVNQGIAKGKQMHADAVRELTGGLSLPGLNDVLERFAGTETEPEKPGEEEKSG